MTRDELRAAITDRLSRHHGPGLTAYELARTLGRHGGQTGIRNVLHDLAAEGRARCVEEARGDGDSRPVFRWTRVSSDGGVMP